MNLGAYWKRLIPVAALAGLLVCPVQSLAAKDVVLAVASILTTTDPWDANDTPSQAVAKSFYQGLFGFNEKMELLPVLAEGFTVTPDGLVYTLNLRKGVKFHDGTDFNAVAVKVNLDRITNPENKLKRYSLYSNIAKTEVVDGHTVKITLKKPFSPFINQLAHPSAAMISPAALEKYGSKGIAFHPVGTGPFEFVDWKQTDYLKVKKNANYWKPGLPKVDSLTWVPVAENNARSAMLRTGEAHFAIVPYEQAEIIAKDPNLEMISMPTIMHMFLSMNMMQKPFNDLRVRQAINYAIDKQALVKVAFNGHAIPAEGVVPAGVDYSVKLGPWPHDVKKAKALLTQAGYPNGFESVIWGGYSTSTKVIQFLQQQLAQVGIKVRVLVLEPGQRVEQVESAPDPAKAPVRMYFTGWSASTGEADWAMRPLFYSGSMPPNMFNTAYYKNKSVDAAIEQALVTTDRSEKQRLYKDVQEQIWQDMPMVFLVTQKVLYATSKNLQGMYVMPDSSFYFEDIELQ